MIFFPKVSLNGTLIKFDQFHRGKKLMNINRRVMSACWNESHEKVASLVNGLQRSAFIKAPFLYGSSYLFERGKPNWNIKGLIFSGNFF